jgi:mono/diheme cytochrome c family protein
VGDGPQRGRPKRMKEPNVITPLSWATCPEVRHVSCAREGAGSSFALRSGVAFRSLGLGVLAVTLLVFSACQAERRKSDAELGLNPTEAQGRALYDLHCGGCHEAYNSRGLKGPSLQGLFKHPYMKNGMPANDERVRDITEHGRAGMPGYGRVMSPRQIDEMMAYLHTL